MIRNFLFHRVNPVRDLLWDPMDVGLFEKCIKYIKEHYEVVQIEDLVFSKDLFAKNNYATIMFDDGYKDNIEYAADILEKNRCKASFYVVTDCIDKNIPTWTHILEHTFQHTSIPEINLGFDFLPDDLKVKKLATKPERIEYVGRLKPFLKKLSHIERNLVLNIVVSTYNDATIPGLMMNWQDLQQLKNAGHYIGSHTMSHCMLGTMNDNKEIEKELRGSAEKIHQHLGHFPLTISYPVGSFNENTKQLSQSQDIKSDLQLSKPLTTPKKTTSLKFHELNCTMSHGGKQG